MRIVYTVLDGRMSGGQVICGNIMTTACDSGHDVCLVTPNRGEFTDELAEKNIDVYTIPMERTFHFSQAIVFARFLRDWNADLVHCHAAVTGTILARIGAKIAGVPLISHVHIENKFSDVYWIRKLQIILYNLTANFVDHILAISNATKLSLVNQGITDNRITVIHNGVQIPEKVVDVAEIKQIKKSLGLKADSKIIGMVARLCPIKGQKEFIYSAHNICDDFSDVEFVIIGEDYEFNGEFRNELQELVDNLGLVNVVHFLGYRNDVKNILSCFDVFVLPSWIEGFPVTILEAMAARKPVVATDVGGVSEIISNYQTGLLIPEKDVLRLTVAIVSLLNDSRKASLISETGYRYVLNNFSHDHMWTQISRLYELYE